MNGRLVHGLAVLLSLSACVAQPTANTALATPSEHLSCDAVVPVIGTLTLGPGTQKAE